MIFVRSSLQAVFEILFDTKHPFLIIKKLILFILMLKVNNNDGIIFSLI
jgi:hypothetical protein